MGRSGVKRIGREDLPAFEQLFEVLGAERQPEWQLLVEQARTGNLGPPAEIHGRADALAWLAWAHTHHHQDSCQCRRCRAARPYLLDASGCLCDGPLAGEKG